MIVSGWARSDGGILEADRPTPKERLALLARPELDRAYRLAGVILGNASDAEDAVGDAIERAHRSIDQLRDPGQFQVWFDRIVVNACRDRLRRRRLPIEGAGERPLDRDPFMSVIEGDAALRALRPLPADERVVIVLRFWADLPVEEIARRLGVPAGTVKSRLHRALARMREELDQ
jgi:RNA polymerase sigma-70 factor (ECF subfamily)